MERITEETGLGVLGDAGDGIRVGGVPVERLGPANWIGYRQNMKEELSFASFYMTAYSPIFWICENGPAPIRDAIVWYCNLWR